jgi:hypothetical protein
MTDQPNGWLSRAQGRARRMASVRGRICVAVGFGEIHFARKRLCTRCQRLAKIHLSIGHARQQDSLRRILIAQCNNNFH